MTEKTIERVHSALDDFRIELPSWGFADTGTCFGKFLQDGAAIDLADKLSDAERLLKQAFGTDVSGAIAKWRQGRGLEEDPLISFRRSGYLQQIEADLKARRKELGIVAGGSYA